MDKEYGRFKRGKYIKKIIKERRNNMSEEEKEVIKMSYPLFTSNEEAQLENMLNFHLDEFVNEINKTMSKDKDIIILKKVIEKQQKEIEELKEEQAKRSWVHIKENGEVEPLFYISKDKIREIISKYVDIEEQLNYASNELFGEELSSMIKELLEE